MKRALKRIAVVSGLLVLGGCASFSPDAGFSDVQKMTSPRLGQDVSWDRGAGTAEPNAAVAKLLQSPLTPEVALQIALLNNRRLQADYESLGIAEADLVQAGDIAAAMSLLAESHDYVIVDAPSRLSEDTLAILDAASLILIVVTYMGATVANARQAIDTFEALGYKGQKPILLVVNQSDTMAGMSKGGLEHALNLPVIAEIPTDWKTVSESLNKQQPFVLSNPTAPVSKALENLANALVSQQRK